MRALWLAVLMPALVCAEGFTLTVHLTGFKSDRGKVAVALFDNAAAYPTKPEKARASVREAIVNGEARVEFKDLPAGTYAIAAYHDANGNGKMDTNFIGIPKEPTGASNDAKGRMGPPSFKAAQFSLSGNQRVTVTMQ
ncbi:MAG: DUF2141 domain-containing protein [Bryobacteraceae bacterium]|nr:DUF2141 domain-containing protein [Bryobacteraceae bacterium]